MGALIRAYLVGLSAVLPLSTFGGEVPSSRPQSLAEVLELAKSRNPDTAAARKSWEAARAQILVSKSLPDPEFGLGYWGINSTTLNLGSAKERWYDISQTFPFPSKLHYRGKAASFEAGRQEALFRATEREILARVKEAYYMLLLADRSVEISKENVEILQKFARIAANKYGVGKTSQSDVLRAQVELSKANNRVVTAEQERETAQARLNALLDRRAEEPFGVLEEPTVAGSDLSYEELEKIALKERPEVQAVNQEVFRVQAQVSEAKAEYWPDLAVQYSWRTLEEGPSDSTVMFKVNVPLWFWKQKSQVDSLKSERGWADATLRSAVASTRSDVKEFLVHVQTARRLVELYRTTLLPQVEQSLRVAEAAYQSDRIDFLNLLDSDRALIDVRLEYYRSLAQYGSGMAHLERVLGVDLSSVKGNSHE